MKKKQSIKSLIKEIKELKKEEEESKRYNELVKEREEKEEVEGFDIGIRPATLSDLFPDKEFRLF